MVLTVVSTVKWTQQQMSDIDQIQIIYTVEVHTVTQLQTSIKWLEIHFERLMVWL